MSANPTLTVDTFDLFSAYTTGYMAHNLELVKGWFPGRVLDHRGSSIVTINSSKLDSPCDLVHVDGQHSYKNVLWDTLNLMRKARPTALYLFDDQCDAQNCSGPNAGVAAQPSLATCDLVATGLLEPVAVVWEGVRQFSLFRQGRRRLPVLSDGTPPLPCEYCQLKMWRDSRHLHIDRSTLRWEQRKMRPRHCDIPAT